MPGEVAVQAAGGVPGPHRSVSGAPPDPGRPEGERQERSPAGHRGGDGPHTGHLDTPVLAAIDDALLAARTKLAVAEARLAESHDEAQSIIKDAVEQAALISGRAEQGAHEQLFEARRLAAELTAATEAAAAKTRREADQLMADAQTGSSRLRERFTADLGQQLAEHEGALKDRVTAHEAELAHAAARAQERLAQRQAQAEAAADATILAAERELEHARLDAATARADAAAEVAQLLESSRADAAREVNAAAEQTRWTQQIIVGLLEAADLDAQRTRRFAHLEAAAIIGRTHGRLAAILARSRARLTERLVVAEREAEAVAERAGAALDRAAVDAIQICEQANADARQTIAQAEDIAAARLDRAERRLLEAEAGARAVREQVADELTKAQRQIHEVRRTAQAQERQAVDAARAEADDVRAMARQLLADAKAEVAALTERRDAIASELGSLSGVIEALAVSDAARPAPATNANGAPQWAAPAHPAPAHPAPAHPAPAHPAPAHPAPAHPAPGPVVPGATASIPGEGGSTNPEHDQPTSLLDEMMRPND